MFSCKKLLATVFTQMNNCITQNKLFQVTASGSSLLRNKTKTVEAIYKSIPKKVCCCLSSSSRSFLNNINIDFTQAEYIKSEIYQLLKWMDSDIKGYVLQFDSIEDVIALAPK